MHPHPTLPKPGTVARIKQQYLVAACGLTLAACRINDPECPVSLPIARDVAKKFGN